jgi:hypothetical protein
MNYEDFTAAELDEAYAEIAELLNERRGPQLTGCVQISPSLYVGHQHNQHNAFPIHFAQHNHVMDCKKDSCWTCYEIAKEHVQQSINDMCIKVMFMNKHKRKVVSKMLFYDVLVGTG